MLARLMPKEGRFFDYFNSSADKILEGCTVFEKLLHDYDNLGTYVQDIRKLEHECDEITHQVIDLVNKVFITPIDREDIQLLIKTMDDVMDLIQAATQRMETYEIRSVPNGLPSMARVLTQAVIEMKNAIRVLENLRDPKELLQHCIEMNRLENECDTLAREYIGRLFREHQDDPLLVMKHKEVYESVEEALDRCEDVANVIETITIKHT
ncbi:MAG: DUF47 domain-containing protein [Acidobacteria bacterium]|nr:DUF47 domain-containing protein [Acidobacteriota bacterium]